MVHFHVGNIWRWYSQSENICVDTHVLIQLLFLMKLSENKRHSFQISCLYHNLLWSLLLCTDLEILTSSAAPVTWTPEQDIASLFSNRGGLGSEAYQAVLTCVWVHYFLTAKDQREWKLNHTKWSVLWLLYVCYFDIACDQFVSRVASAVEN